MIINKYSPVEFIKNQAVLFLISFILIIISTISLIKVFPHPKFLISTPFMAVGFYLLTKSVYVSINCFEIEISDNSIKYYSWVDSILKRKIVNSIPLAEIECTSFTSLGDAVDNQTVVTVIFLKTVNLNKLPFVFMGSRQEDARVFQEELSKRGVKYS